MASSKDLFLLKKEMTILEDMPLPNAEAFERVDQLIREIRSSIKVMEATLTPDEVEMVNEAYQVWFREYIRDWKTPGFRRLK